jgi:hypothetical protein
MEHKGGEGPPVPKTTKDAGECCQISQMVDAPGFSWSPPADPTPPPACGKGTGTAGEALVGEVVSASADPHMTPAMCCAQSGDKGVGYTVFSGEMPFYPAGLSKCPAGAKCCVVFGSVESKVHPLPSCPSRALPAPAAPR